jgi:hypothetical protein
VCVCVLQCCSAAVCVCVLCVCVALCAFVCSLFHARLDFIFKGFSSDQSTVTDFVLRIEQLDLVGVGETE